MAEEIKANSPAPPSKKEEKPPPKDNWRESLETVVFVVVLVLMLKSFVAEAYVIPTGSMATTLYGYQLQVTCPQCGFEFPVNCSIERDPPPPQRDQVVACTCPNCIYHINFAEEKMRPGCRSGDMVLVAKCLYEAGLKKPERYDVVVFKNPQEPQKNFQPHNYIKRLVGKSGETLAIADGDVYVYPPPGGQAEPFVYPGRPLPDNLDRLWERDFMNENDPEAMKLFQDGKFQIQAKPPDKVLAMRRIVFNNDHQPADLTKAKFHPRWSPESIQGNPEQAAVQGWSGGDKNSFRHPAGEGDPSWLGYRHLMILRSKQERLPPPDEVQPQLITDILGYNSWEGARQDNPPATPHWVGDLILECKVDLDKADGPLTGMVVLELAKGVDRFQARWLLGTGECTLIRIEGAKEETLGTKPAVLKAGKSYLLRFANVDRRLTVWVDGDLPFGKGLDYPAPSELGPTKNDLQPASIGAQGAGCVVSRISLWRDLYYTDQPGPMGPGLITDWTNPKEWSNWKQVVRTFFVRPDHYLCLGDNSPASSDSRYWGLVPDRLMLGRALMVYWPFGRQGPIR